MKEIKIVFGKGGKVKMLAGGSKGKGTANFTEKLSKELGVTEERHKGETYEKQDQGQNVDQGTG